MKYSDRPPSVDAPDRMVHCSSFPPFVWEPTRTRYSLRSEDVGSDPRGGEAHVPYLEIATYIFPTHEPMQPTASKSALLIQCARPFDPKTPLEDDSPGEAAQYGTAFHAAIDVLAKGRRETTPKGEMAKHVAQVWTLVKQWLDGDNPFGRPFHIESTEQHLASSIQEVKGQYILNSREADFDEATHTYQLNPGEFGGTPDLVVSTHTPKLFRVVLDYKTGVWGDFARPERMAQMMTLALQTNADAVGIIHCPRNLPPAIYVEELTPNMLVEHAAKLAVQFARIGDGSMRVGPECERCRARASCPTNTGELLIQTTALVKRVTGDNTLPTRERSAFELGQFHMMLGDLEALTKRAREEIKARVAAGEVVQRPDGKTLAIIQKTTERISKSGIVKALGNKEGEKMLEKLRKLGALTEETHDELRAIKD